MKTIFGIVLAGLLLGIVFTGITLLSEIFGLSRISDYFSTYSGSMSYKYYKITFRPIAKQSVEDISFPNLKYGYELDDNKLLKVNVLQSEIPYQNIEYIFYNTKNISATFSPDSIYLAWVGIRGNYFSFPFRDKYGFQITQVSAYVGADEEVSIYPTLEANWANGLKLYAWVSIFLETLFLMALVSLLNMDEPNRYARFFPILFIVLFGAAGLYVDYVDYEAMGWPIFRPILILLLIGWYLYTLFFPEEELEKTA
ncbi:hypothetical protein SAMN05421780_10239 [Flexibacter flexilis DSM 6793]|uniref:Uncharacterized protein n=1 Tax=Flexibacter flexilis DSM 6793 TaxID=927664 RepID=A0A1I1F3P4_9BACT|nr:hypothetical protein [Flexibacter flexilis]SFB94015.1 hypothetical protein SAMN05421780_10239 [Flexibacter flexilis DSM 6793]